MQKKIEPLLSSDAEKQLYQKVLDQRKVFLGTRAEVIKLKLAGQADEATQLFQSSYLPAAATYQKMIEELVKRQETEMEANAAQIDATAGTSLTLLSALTGLVLLFGTVCAWMLTAGITRPLKRAMAAARQVAEGDLTGDIVVDSSDEVGQLLQNLKDMNHKLLAIVGRCATAPIRSPSPRARSPTSSR